LKALIEGSKISDIVTGKVTKKVLDKQTTLSTDSKELENNTFD